MGKCLVLFVSVWAAVMAAGCCSSLKSSTECAFSSSRYFWEIVATPVHSEKVVEANQCYKLRVALKEQTASGEYRTLVNLPAMDAAYNDPADIHINHPGFRLDGTVAVQKESSGDMIHYTFDTHRKGVDFKTDGHLPVKRG